MSDEFHSVGDRVGSIFEPLHRLGKIGSDTLRRLLLSLKQHHGCQRLALLICDSFQTRLIVANGIPENTFDPITSWSASSRTTHGNADLKRAWYEFGRHEAVYDPDDATSDGVAGRIVPLEKGLDEPPMLDTSRYRKRKRRIVGAEGRASLTHRIAYFPLFVSVTVRFFLPFARRRARTRRPFLVAMRERKPCLLARLRRLG